MKGLINKVLKGLSWRLLRWRTGSVFWNKVLSVVEFYAYHNRVPNLVRPKSFNEHMLKLKVSSELGSALRTRISDKEYLKDYVRERVGDQFNVRTITVLHSIDAARNYQYPDRCVIKPTHMSAQVILRTSGHDGIDFDKVSSWFSCDFYKHCRELNYRALTPKVIVEEFVDFSGNGQVPEDYKIFCFYGKPKFIQVDAGRFSGDHRRRFYTPEWDPLPFSITYPLGADVPRPNNLDAMLHVAERLSQGLSSIRVDLYSNGESCLVGEMTNCHGSAREHFIPPSADVAAGRFFRDPDLDPTLAFSKLGTGNQPSH
jgi:hypothetical protein